MAKWRPEELGQYWRDYDNFMERQVCREHGNFRVQSHEELIANLESEARDLLAFCGLEWDQACLRPHQSPRAVRTASAAQVRQPLRTTAAITALYGDHFTSFERHFSGACREQNGPNY